MRREVVEDLVRIEAEMGRKLPDDPKLIFAAMPSEWSVAEHAIHVALSQLDCAQRFEAAWQAESGSDLTSTFGQKITLGYILSTYRLSGGQAARPELIPLVMVPKPEILAMLRDGRSRLLDLEKRVASQGKDSKAVHPRLGPMSFAIWVRYLLIHALHHKSLMAKVLRQISG